MIVNSSIEHDTQCEERNQALTDDHEVYRPSSPSSGI